MGIQPRVGHGLDPSMDWIGLDWIGLGQDFEETLWIGLDWVRWLQFSVFFLCSRLTALWRYINFVLLLLLLLFHCFASVKILSLLQSVFSNSAKDSDIPTCYTICGPNIFHKLNSRSPRVSSSYFLYRFKVSVSSIFQFIGLGYLENSNFCLSIFS